MLLEARDNLARFLERPGVRLLGELAQGRGCFAGHRGLRGADTRNAAASRQMRRSKRADREIAQPQVGELPFLPQPEQSPIECLSQQIIATPDRDADAFAEKPALQVRSTLEHAAVGGIGSV